MVMGVLSSALDLAKAAVAHDEQGAQPEKVLPYYKKVRREGLAVGEQRTQGCEKKHEHDSSDGRGCFPCRGMFCFEFKKHDVEA